MLNEHRYYVLRWINGRRCISKFACCFGVCASICGVVGGGSFIGVVEAPPEWIVNIILLACLLLVIALICGLVSLCLYSCQENADATTPLLYRELVHQETNQRLLPDLSSVCTDYLQ